MTGIITLADIMTRPVITLSQDKTVHDALLLMQTYRISAIVIVDNQKPIGVFTEQDAVVFRARSLDAKTYKITEAITQPVLTASPALQYHEAYALIAENKARHLVLTDEAGLLCGVVSEANFMKHLGKEYLFQFKNVESVMSGNVVTLTRQNSVKDAINTMAHERVSCVVITDGDTVQGMITQRDVVNVPIETNAGTLAIADIMSTPVQTIPPSMPLPKAIQRMDEFSIRRLAVVNQNGLLCGIITRHDIVKQLYETSIEELHDALARTAKELSQTREELRITRQLQATEARLQTLLESVPYGIQDTDTCCTIQYCNRAYQKILGYSEAELLGKKVWEFLSLEEDQEEMQQIALELNERQPTPEPMIYSFRRRDGEQIWVQYDWNYRRDAHGKHVGYTSIITDITDRLNTESSLRESEAKFRALFEQTGGYCMILDPNTESGIPTIVDANQAACELHGYTRDEFIGRPVSDIDDDEGKRLVKARTQQIMTGKPFYVENTHVRKDGSTFSVAVNANRIDIPGIQPLIFTTEFDISTRTQAEENLRQTEEIVSSSKDLLALVDKNYRYLTTNPAYLDAFGFNPDDGVGHTIEDLFGAETFNNVIKPRAEECLSGKTVHYQGWFDYPKLGRKYMDIHYYPYLDSNNNVQGFVVNSRDETERMRAEEKLRESSKQLQETQKIALLGSWEFDLTNNRLFWSDEVFRIFGLEPDSTGIAFEAFIEHVHPDDREYIAGLSQRLIEKNTVEFQYRIIRSGEEIRWISGQGKTRRDESGNIVAMFGFKQDVTRAHALETRLLQSKKLESVGRLAGGVAHDFNNMLGVILGHADLILAKSKADDPLHGNLVHIKQAAERSAELTGQLLAFARKQTALPRVINPNENVSDMVNMLERMIGENIDLIWMPCTNPYPVEIDPSQLDQILVNLCLNARDAISEVGQVTIKTENVFIDENDFHQQREIQSGHYLLLTISDNGCGISSGSIDSIFEPFFTTKISGQNTGLGLATVYGVVQQNNGFIEVDSVPDQGTIFRIYLPRHYGEDKEPAIDSWPATVNDKGRETILVVEDEPMLLELTSTMLEKFGYRVIAAKSPSHALSLVSDFKEDIHLIVSDIVMPEMNGSNLSREIASSHPGIKCLFMSGYTADVIGNQGILNETTNFIQKPFLMKDLSRKVRETLDGPLC